ncbi:unnamed protein product, partial [Meganyctiphanes norvegica]
VCGGPGPGVAGCLDTIGNSAGSCDCDTIGNSGFLTDPYDSTKYIICFPPDQQVFFSCAEGQTFDTTVSMCTQSASSATSTPSATSTTPTLTTTSAGGPPVCNATGYHEYAPDCKK